MRSLENGPEQESSTRNGKLGVLDYVIPKKKNRLVCESKTIGEIFWVKGRYLSGPVKILPGE